MKRISESTDVHENIMFKTHVNHTYTNTVSKTCLLQPILLVRASDFH